jgi:hypothetical protein
MMSHRSGDWIGVLTYGTLALAAVVALTGIGVLAAQEDRPDRTVYSECDGTTLIYTTNQGVAIARNSTACGGSEP